MVIFHKSSEMDRHKRERNRLTDLFQSGIVKKEEVEEKLKGTRSKLAQLTGEINYLSNQEKESRKLLTVITNVEEFFGNISKSLDSHSFEEKRNIVKFLIEEVEVDTVREKINVKHIIPMDPKKCRLRSGTHESNAIEYSYIMY